MFTTAQGSHEYPIAYYANKPSVLSGGARFMPVLKELKMNIGGHQFPSASGLNNATLTEIKNYTEMVDGFSTGVDVFSYGGHKFYTCFSYTGNQNLFVVPTINVDVGEKVNARLVQLVHKFIATPQAAAEGHCYVYHYGKRLIVWQPNLAMRILD